MYIYVYLSHNYTSFYLIYFIYCITNSLVICADLNYVI